MTYADSFNLRTATVKFNDVADAVDGVISRLWGGTSSGSGSAYAVSVTPAPVAYSVGMTVSFLPNVSNTGLSTLTVNGLGAKNVLFAGYNLRAGQLVTNVLATVVYDGTYWHLSTDAGDLTSYAPAVSGDGIVGVSSVGVDQAIYRQVGKLIWVSVSLVFTTTTSASGKSIGVSLPATSTNADHMFPAAFQDNAPWMAGVGIIPTTNLGAVAVSKYDNANWALGVGRRVKFQGWYRVA